MPDVGALLSGRPELVGEAARLARAERFGLARDDFARALEESVRRYAQAAEGKALRDFVLGLRLEDLALATACACGIEAAWDEFHAHYRQYLVDVCGECDLADHVIAQLYGAEGRGRMADFRGRSSLKGWLRAIVYQAQVDRHRREERLVELDAVPVELGHVEHFEDFERRDNAAALAEALRSEIGALPAAERLLLAWYYVDQLRLAAIARLRGVHESTISRDLDAIRKQLRKRVTSRLRDQGFSEARVEECFQHATDAPVDFAGMLPSSGKEPAIEQARNPG